MKFTVDGENENVLKMDIGKVFKPGDFVPTTKIGYTPLFKNRTADTEGRKAVIKRK